MYQDTTQAVGNAAYAKVRYLEKNPLGYFVYSMLAGAYVGFGILLINTIGGLLNGNAATKIVMGCSFGIALSLVIIAGSELFTGNNMVMTIGMIGRKTTMLQALKLWSVCWVGNLVGSCLLAFLYHLSGAFSEPVATFIASGAAAKMSAPALQLFVRGILCNILVCLAVWSSFRCKSEAGKLIMIFWCLFAFITCGFEHSVANMTLLAVGLLHPMGQALSVGGYFYNLLFVTLGNMVGGIVFLGLPYALGAREK
ncbi:MAG: formate/nitrite transporter family protein [Lachnospiraceae bacterium]|nr:formate/nitrite transporter family protein [Lachnospiraceae bacterium]